MKAMRLDEPAEVGRGPLRQAELPVPQPRAGQVLIRVRACGVCHTDLHTVEGELPLPKLPVTPGHEVIGVVEARADGAERFNVGQRVGVAWLNSTCGKCRYCRDGRENLCPRARFTGYHVDGGYGEYLVIDEAFAYEVPEGLDDVAAAPLLCAGIIGYRAFKLAEATPGCRLGLYGFGASAHIVIQIAVDRGCEVYVFSRSEAHRRLARQLGAVWTGRAEQEPPHRLDSAIMFAPAGRLVPEALRVLDRGGVLALAGIYMTALPELDYHKHLYYERTVRSVTAATRQDGQELLALAGRIGIRTTTQPYRLEQANEVLAMLKAGQINGAAVLVVGQ